MGSATTGSARVLEWGVATLTLAGQKESGDLHLVKPVNHGVLVAVVDGLGHGEGAAVAAKGAVRILERYAEEPLTSLLQRCHDALIGTRGAVMSLAFVDAATRALSWLGVGNVEGLLVPAEARPGGGGTSLLTLGGIVGSELPLARPSEIPLNLGDTLVLATDGVRTDFRSDVSPKEPPQRLADGILTRYGKGTDDALVLVARYLGTL